MGCIIKRCPLWIFKKFPERKKKAWYVYAGDSNNAGKQYLLEGVGVTPLPVTSSDAIYGAETWS